jgi:hypothetical protein
MLDMDLPPTTRGAIVNRDFTARGAVFTERIREIFDGVLDEALDKRVEFVEDVAARLPMRSSPSSSAPSIRPPLPGRVMTMLGWDDPEYAIDPEVAEANRDLCSQTRGAGMFEYGRKLKGSAASACATTSSPLAEAEIDGRPLTHTSTTSTSCRSPSPRETTRHRSRGAGADREPEQPRLRCEPDLLPPARTRSRQATPAPLPPHRNRRGRVRRIDRENDKLATWHRAISTGRSSEPYSFDVGATRPADDLRPGGPHFRTGAHLARLGSRSFSPRWSARRGVRAAGEGAPAVELLQRISGCRCSAA